MVICVTIYGHPYRGVHIGVSWWDLSGILCGILCPIYDRTYMDVQIWTSIYGRSYMDTPTCTLIYGRPYMDVHIWSRLKSYAAKIKFKKNLVHIGLSSKVAYGRI